MSVSLLQLVTVCCLLLWIVYRFLISVSLSSSSSFPLSLSEIPNAHFTSSILPTWIWWARRAGHETRSILAAHRAHGSIVRLAPNEVSVASLDGLRQVYLGGFNRHSSFYSRFVNYKTPALFTMLPYEDHSARKRMLTRIYSKSYIQSSTDLKIISGELLFRRFLPILHSSAKTGAPRDVFQLFHAASMDFMSAYIFGLWHSTNFMQDLAYCAHYLHLSRVKLFGLRNHSHAVKEIEEHCLSMCRAVERDLKAPPKAAAYDVPRTTPVVYSQLSSAFDKSNLSPNDKLVSLAAEMLDAMDAARESNTITLTYILHELSRSPLLQASLRAELLSLSPRVSSSLLPSSNNQPDADSSTLPAPSAIDALPLLHSIVLETLRVHAPVQGPQPRVVPVPSIIDGYAIPAGTRISTSACCLHCNADVFPDPNRWLPERWLVRDDEGPERIKEMRRWFWAFGNGGRMCIGNHFALQVIKLLVAAVYTNFTTTIIEDEGMEHRDDVLSGPVSDRLILQFHHIGK